jgi:hypothetical protein
MKRDDVDHSADVRRDRAKYVPCQPASNDVGNAPAFTLTADQLAAVVRGAVAEALASREPAPATMLLDRNGIAEALDCSPSLVDKMRRRGMPHVRLGDSPRFELAAVLDWVRKDGSS